MSGKYSDIRRDINRQSRSFKMYVLNFVCDRAMRELLTSIAAQTEVYIFSGVIRNFLMGYSENRDFDFVVKDIQKVHIPLSLVRRLQMVKNKFGGYKLCSGSCMVDVWPIEKTWGMQNEGMRFNEHSLIRSAFFNFSAIVYDFNRSCFVFDDDFCRFFQTHEMEVVYAENPYVETCVLNTLYYASKYDFPIGYRLARWVAQRAVPSLDYHAAQQRRFGKQVFSAEQIADFISLCRSRIIRKNPVYVGKETEFEKTFQALSC